MSLPSLSPLWVSLNVSFVATLVIVFPGIWVAWKLRGKQGKRVILIESLIILPMILPPTVVGFCLLFFFGRHGIAGKLLSLIHFSIVFNQTGAIVAASLVAFPLFYKTVKASFEQIDINLVHAAKTLGANKLKIFYTIILPLSAPGIAAGLTLAFLRALGEFGATLMIAGNIPGKTQTIPVALFFAVEGGDYRTATFWAMGVLLLSISMMLLIHILTRSKNHAAN